MKATFIIYAIDENGNRVTYEKENAILRGVGNNPAYAIFYRKDVQKFLKGKTYENLHYGNLRRSLGK